MAVRGMMFIPRPLALSRHLLDFGRARGRDHGLLSGLDALRFAGFLLTTRVPSECCREATFLAQRDVGGRAALEIDRAFAITDAGGRGHDWYLTRASHSLGADRIASEAQIID